MPGRIQQTSHLAGSTTASGGTQNSLQVAVPNNNSTSKQPFLSKNTNASTSSATGAGSSASKNSDNELLEVTVIPVDEQPYSKHVQIPLIGAHSRTSMSSQASGPSGFTQATRGGSGTGPMQGQTNQYPSLKDLFQNSDSLWRPIFGSFVGVNKKPQFAIFRKPIERRRDIAGIKRDTELSLHILYLKRDITQFPRNAFANQIEVYCSKFFYGPLVVVFCDTKPPYKLHDFPPYYLIDEIEPLNELEQKCYPLPFGAKKCSLVRALMSEERFTHNLENLERVLSNHEFMLYCYKTSFCPISNSTIHDWSKCNYAHRQQDFRRPPYLFFYYPERCPHIGDDGSWEACEYELHCDYAHTLVEILFNPLHYKFTDCAEKTSADRFKCVKHKERCCHAHSNEEKKLCNQVLEQLVPKVLPQKEDIMQYYLEMLPDYQTAPATSAGSGRGNEYGSESSPATTQATTLNASGQRGGQGDQMDGEDSDDQAHLKMQARRKSPIDPTKAAANLQKASDLQRQKFMDVFTQMQASSPAAAALTQKTYKIKSEVKPVIYNGAHSALLRPENPFSKVKPVVINPMAVSPKYSAEKVNEQYEPAMADFRPFGDALSSAGSPDKPTIFDKLDNKVTKNEIAQKIEKMEAENVATIKAATAKVDKRTRGKKGGKLVKGVVTITSSTQDDIYSNGVTPEKDKREASLPKTVSEAIPQLPSLLKAQQQAQITVVKQHERQEISPALAAGNSSQRKYQQQPQVITPDTRQRKQHNINANSSTLNSQAYLEESKDFKSQQSRPQNNKAQQETYTQQTISAGSKQLENKTAQSLAASIALSSAALKASASKDLQQYENKPSTYSPQKLDSTMSSMTRNKKTIAEAVTTRKKQKGGAQQPAGVKTASQASTSMLKKASSTILPPSQAQSSQNSNNPEEYADYDDLPQSAKESTEADIKMVKLQLLQHQMDSLQISQEDSDHFYLQQISEARFEAQKDNESSAVYQQQSSSLVPLLSSRSNSPTPTPTSDSIVIQRHMMKQAPVVVNAVVNNTVKTNNNHQSQSQPQQNMAAIQQSRHKEDDDDDDDEQREQLRPHNEEQIHHHHNETRTTKNRDNNYNNNNSMTTNCEMVVVNGEGSEQRGSRPSRLKKQSADTAAGKNNSGASTSSSGERDQQPPMMSSCSTVAAQQQNQHSQQLTNHHSTNRQQQHLQRNGPPELMVYRQLAGDYSAIEVADFFEAASIRLIALGFAELGYQRMVLRRGTTRNYENYPTNNENDGSIPSELQQQQQQHRALQQRRMLMGQEEDNTDDDYDIITTIVEDDGRIATDVSIPRAPTMMQQASNSSSLQSRLQPQVARQDMVLYQMTTTRMTPTLPLLLEGSQHLQVTHNRLLGSGRRGQAGWLYAFSWSLFVDPITVWNACEVRELAAARRCPNRQWLISFNNGTKMDGIAQLDASETVPPIIRHIWGLPLATSEGFGDMNLPGNPMMYHSQQRQHQQLQPVPNNTGSTPPVFALSPNTAAADSQTKQGAFRATQPPQIYKKGNNAQKQNRNSNNQTSFQFSTFSDQNKA